ncbi:MAG: hypothetical protein ABIR18_01270 [Chitinophagaceae bacterium]
MKPSKTDIQSFWNWFSKHHTQIHSESISKENFAVLDKTISGWGLSWELSPGITTGNSLSISGQGNRELSKIALQIVLAAPSIKDWEFFSFRQPKENWQHLKLPGNNIDIDASDWKYVLTKTGEGKLELVIQANNITGVKDELQETVVQLVLINLLGEEKYISDIYIYEIVEDLEDEFPTGITSIQYLPERLNKLTR